MKGNGKQNGQRTIFSVLGSNMEPSWSPLITGIHSAFMAISRRNKASKSMPLKYACAWTVIRQKYVEGGGCSPTLLLQWL